LQFADWPNSADDTALEWLKDFSDASGGDYRRARTVL